MRDLGRLKEKKSRESEWIDGGIMFKNTLLVGRLIIIVVFVGCYSARSFIMVEREAGTTSNGSRFCIPSESCGRLVQCQ